MPISIAFFAALIALFAASQTSADQKSDYVVLNFTAKWCQPCNQMSGSMDQLSQQGWLIRQVNVESEKELVARWRVTELPTLIVLKHGREIDRMTGLMSFPSLTNRLPQFDPKESRPGVPISALLPPIPAEHAYVDPLQATVRLKIEDGQSTSFGSGTIIDQYGDEALVLTCGHLFRDLTSQAHLTVDVSVAGHLITLPATLVDFQCNETDIGLIAFRPGHAISVASLLPRGVTLKEQESVASFGCDHGADPSRRDSFISKLNRYIGPPNIEVAKAPVQGRSGGGLFNAQGQLIGVCYAADSELDEGLYSGPEVVYTQLARLGLGRLYNPTPNLQSVASKSSIPPSKTLVATGAYSDAFPDRSRGDRWKSAVEQATNEAREMAAKATAAIARQSNEAMLTAIIRDAQGREQRLTIPSPSPALVQILQSQSALNAPN